jgi:hypothetical protein
MSLYGSINLLRKFHAKQCVQIKDKFYQRKLK